jgi:hypothetical protein
MGTPTAPSMDIPLALNKDWLPLLDAGSWSKDVPKWTMGEEPNLDAAGTMLPGDDSLGSTSHWWND